MDDLEEYYNARKQIASHIDNSYSINGEKRNSRVPKPPKPGEIIYCKMCGLAMMPEDFSKDKKIRKKEFKWQCHYACMKKAEELCDLKTVGLLAERQALANKYKEPVHKYRLPNK